MCQKQNEYQVVERVNIELPSIRDDDAGYNFLFKLAKQIMSNPYRMFDFDFRKCSVLDQNAVAMLGGLARYIDAHNTIANRGIGRLILPRAGVMFKVDTMSSLISSQLIKNNFLSHFSKENFEGYPKGDYIGYREHTEYLDANEIALHLHNEWLSDEKLSVSEDLKNAVVSRIFEIFMNAYGHGVERGNIGGLGVISCGMHKKKEKQLKLTVIDFGIGIVENVREYLKSPIKDEECMRWALKTGNSTRTDSIDDIPRGLGFGLLEEFVFVNEGSFKVFSNTCTANVDKDGGYKVEAMKTPFSGTVVSISINCDDRHYKFVSEDNTSEQFY